MASELAGMLLVLRCIPFLGSSLVSNEMLLTGIVGVTMSLSSGTVWNPAKLGAPSASCFISATEAPISGCPKANQTTGGSRMLF